MSTLLQVAPATAPGLAPLHALLGQVPTEVAEPRRLAPQRDLYNEIVQEALRTQFDTPTTRAIKYMLAAYGIGFRAARTGDAHAARTEFARADELFAQQEASYSAPALAFLNCLVLPYRAYHCYSRRLFDEAGEKTQAAILNMTRLEGQVAAFHMARIQQLHNLSRISFKRGDVPAGATLVHALLGYLVTGAPPALAGDWAPELLHHTPPTLRADMFSQVFMELVGMLFQQPDPALRRHLFTLGFGALSGLASAAAFWPPYQAWLQAYEALLFADEGTYAPLLAAYLATPGHAHDLLKLGLLLELQRSLPPAGEAPAGAALLPLLPPYARRALWVAERYLALLE